MWSADFRDLLDLVTTRLGQLQAKLGNDLPMVMSQAGYSNSVLTETMTNLTYFFRINEKRR
jgi:hypothetical protein